MIGQPDFMAISWSNKKFAIWPELCRPFYTRAEAYGRKLQAYIPSNFLLEQHFKNTVSGWTVPVLPSVMGAQGLVHEQSLHNTLKFFGITRK